MKDLLKLSVFGIARQEKKQAEYRKYLLRQLSKMGGELFGPIPAGHRREFFCLDRHTWVWHEEWKDSQGEKHILTTRYDVRPSGVLKSQGTNHYQSVDKAEFDNLRRAVHLYQERMNQVLPQLAAAYNR